MRTQFCGELLSLFSNNLGYINGSTVFSSTIQSQFKVRSSYEEPNGSRRRQTLMFVVFVCSCLFLLPCRFLELLSWALDYGSCWIIRVSSWFCVSTKNSHIISCSDVCNCVPRLIKTVCISRLMLVRNGKFWICNGSTNAFPYTRKHLWNYSFVHIA